MRKFEEGEKEGRGREREREREGGRKEIRLSKIPSISILRKYLTITGGKSRRHSWLFYPREIMRHTSAAADSLLAGAIPRRAKASRPLTSVQRWCDRHVPNGAGTSTVALLLLGGELRDSVLRVGLSCGGVVSVGDVLGGIAPGCTGGAVP